MARYRLEVGETHGVKPGNIVGAIANEMGLESEFIDKINIMDDHSTVDLPEGMPNELFKQFREIRVAGRTLDATCLSDSGDSRPAPAKKRSVGPAGPRGGKRPPRQGNRPGDRGGNKPPRRK